VKLFVRLEGLVLGKDAGSNPAARTIFAKCPLPRQDPIEDSRADKRRGELERTACDQGGQHRAGSSRPRAGDLAGLQQRERRGRALCERKRNLRLISGNGRGT